MINLGTASVVACIALSLFPSAYAGLRTRDEDLSPPTKQRILDQVPLTLSPDEVLQGEGPLSVQILRQDHGKLVPIAALPIRFPETKTSGTTDANGSIAIQSCSGSTTRIEAELTRERRFSVTNGYATYKITAEVPCAKSTQLVFHSDSNGGQALGIWQIAHLAETRLASEIDMNFWSSPLTFVWPEPDDANYYSQGQVHISRGDHWDVVGHELGHGIYDLGNLGQFGGGAHKIDECYSEDLALSEGWASFFSAWVSVDLSDPDAKFEYMVPRRAPIRFENIPADVCQGETNEWRVTGFFWDLVDTHDDGEKSAESFARMWNALLNSRAGSASEARTLLQKSGISPESLETLWKLNFQR